MPALQYQPQCLPKYFSIESEVRSYSRRMQSVFNKALNAEVWDESGKECVSRLETLSGYTLTAVTAVLIAEKILKGNFKSGYQTPAMMYGADLILEVETSKRVDA